MAVLLGQAATMFNTAAIPLTYFGVNIGEKSFPPATSGILIWGLRLEIMRHLSRSYVEVPVFANMSVTYTDRTNYQQRWLMQLQEETPRYEKALLRFKRSMLKLGRGSLLVAGGPYFGVGGRGIFMPGMYSAQVRAFRFYPAAPAISWGNMMGR
jgi:hypothetical protein